MITKIDKHFKYILIIFLLFLVNVPKVMAADNYELNICDGGYIYNVNIERDKSKKETVMMFFDQDTGKSKGLLTDKSGNLIENQNVEEYRFSYRRGGTYKLYGNPLNSTRCYTIAESQISTASQNGTTITKGDIDVEPNVCGQDRLIAYGAGYGTGEDSGDIKIETIDYNHDGLFDVKIIANSDYLKQNWEYVSVTSIQYTGAGYSHQSELQRYGAQKFNNEVDKNVCPEGYCLVIRGIQPNQKNETTGATGDGTFIVTLAIENNEHTDGYDENSSEEAKLHAESIKAQCGTHFFLGEWYTTIPDASTVKINNPVKGAAVCEEVRAYEKAGATFREKYIYECYNGTILYTEAEGLEKRVQDKLDKIKSIYKDKVYTEDGGLAYQDNLLCTNKYLGIPSGGSSDNSTTNNSATAPFESKVTYEYTGTYWGMVCVEEYYIESDNPQLVKAGMGVHYNNKVEVKKQCFLFNIKQVTKKPQCSLKVHTPICLDPGGRTWSDMSTGGPTEEFDSCVNSCDNGQYTQACINQCYSQVYSSDRKLSISNSRTNDTFINKIAKSEKASSCSFNSYDGNNGCDNGIKITCDPNAYCNDNGKNGTCYVKDAAGNVLQSVCYSAWCNNHDGGTSTQCTVSWSVVPDNCSWNPDQDFQNELTASNDEFTKLQTLMEERSEIENYTMEFLDSKDDVVYKVSGNSTETADTSNLGEPRLLITDITNDTTKTTDGITNKSNQTTVTFASDGQTKTFSEFVERTTVYEVKLPLQYSIKGDANTIIAQGLDGKYYTFKDDISSRSTEHEDLLFGDKKYYNFTSTNLSEFGENPQKLLSTGENVYYTALDAGSINLKTYTSTTTNSICGITINQTNTSSSTMEDTEGITTAKGGPLDENQVYTVFGPNAYIFYKENGKNYLKVLIPNTQNIKVSFKIKSVNDIADDKQQEPVEKYEFITSGYSCYYGVYNYLYTNSSDTNDSSTIDTCPDQDPDSSIIDDTPNPTPTVTVETTNTGLRYYYREIYLNPNENGYGGIFNDRNPRWNWTGTIKNGQATGAANNSDPNYIVDPEKLIEDIEAKGDSIFTNDSEIDYEFTMTKSIINQIREYNKGKNDDGTKRTYLDFSLVGTSDNSNKNTYSKAVSEWYSSLASRIKEISNCNNASDPNC